MNARLWIGRDWRWEFAFNPAQWMIGLNYFEGGWNFFFLCFRFGRNSDSFVVHNMLYRQR